MGSDSSRGWRGWLYAIVVATLLSVGFWQADQLANRRGRSFYQADRTTKHRAISTSFKQELTLEEPPIIFQESMEVDESREWIQHRSEPATSMLATVEPSVSVQLMAPQLPNRLETDESIAATSPQDWPESTSGPIRVTSTPVASTPIDREPIAKLPMPLTTPILTSATNGWPRPEMLMREMNMLSDMAAQESEMEVQEWVTSSMRLLQDLTSMQTMQDARCMEVLSSLRMMGENVLQAKDRSLIQSEEVAKQQYRVAYAMVRRTAVWQGVAKCMLQSGTEEGRFVSTKTTAIDYGQLKADVLEMQKAIQATGDAKNWHSYLLMDSIQEIAQQPTIDAEKATKVARTFLSRIHWERVNVGQRNLLSKDFVQRVGKTLQPMAYGPVDYRQLLSDLEAMETEPTHRCRTSLAHQVQAMRFGAGAPQTELAEQINTFYRNANLRIAVSEEMLQRSLPQEQIVERPVHNKILGADTRGASQVNTRLQVDLKPDKHAWNIDLKLQGDVMSNTRSSKGPATFYNDSTALIDTARHIRVDVNGLKVSGQMANVASQDRLKGFNTDFDSLPILGDMLRYVVRQQFDSERGIAQRIVRRTIGDQADNEFDKTLTSKVADAEKQLQGKVLRPLERLELNPLIVDLETTEKRIIARYRIAGSSQMGAHTPRPLAPSDSYMSMQIHESAINNAIDKIGLQGREWTLAELGQQLGDILEQPNWRPSEDVPQDLTIRFADARPITVEFVDGKVELTLRIAELYQPEQLNLKDFIIRTTYVPNVRGLDVALNHIGPISVDSQRDRLKLRAVFARVFAARETIPLVNEQILSDRRGRGLAVSQAKIVDGWLALAVSPEDSPHVALLRTGESSATR